MGKFKRFGFICLGVLVVVIGSAILFQSKGNSEYVLEYIDKCGEEKNCSLLVRKNGEVLTNKEFLNRL